MDSLMSVKLISPLLQHIPGAWGCVLLPGTICVMCLEHRIRRLAFTLFDLPCHSWLDVQRGTGEIVCVCGVDWVGHHIRRLFWKEHLLRTLSLLHRRFMLNRLREACRGKEGWREGVNQSEVSREFAFVDFEEAGRKEVSAAVPARCEGCGKFAQTSTEVSLVDLHPTETCSDKMASSVASCQTGSRGQRFTSA
ncbi:hypothetical protein KSS87_006218 [Heliosperma pusillum]|nr:hypothetical protein KSS87_006218 [Heliosperma pusillum]